MKNLKTKKLTGNKVVYIIVSLVIAIFLWMYVEYVEQPDIEQSITHVPVTLVGEDVLQSRGLMLTEGTNTYVTVRIKGTRNAVYKVSEEDIVVSVDLSGITEAGEYQRGYNISFTGNVSGNEISVVSRSPGTVFLHVSNMATKEVNVYGTLIGKVADEYAAEEFVFDPAKVTVTGVEEKVAQVEYAYVVINMDNVGETIEQEVEYTLMNDKDEVVDKNDFILSVDTIHATLPIVKVKTLPLELELTPGGGLTQDTVNVDILPKEITISGEESAIDELESISLGSINLGEISTAESVMTFTIDIPQGMKNISGETEATAVITIGSDMDTRSYTVTDFRLENPPEGFVGTVVTQTLEVDLRGRSEDFDDLDDARITAVAELSSLGSGSGTYSVPVTVEIEGADGLGAVGEYVIYVQLIALDE